MGLHNQGVFALGTRACIHRTTSGAIMIPFKMAWKIITTYQYRITWYRVVNLVKIGISEQISQKRRSPRIWGDPALLMIEPTNICNLHCPMCPSGTGEMTRPRGKMDVRAIRKVLDEIGHSLVLIQFWNQGEPFVHPEFLDIVAYAKSKGIACMTSTNGHFLKTDDEVQAVIDSGLDEIIISLDGVDQKTYEKYRVGGNYQTVLDGITRLVAAKKRARTKRPIIHLQYLVMKHNEAYVDQIVSRGKELGVDLVSLKTAQVYTEEQAESFLPEDEKYRRYSQDSEGVHIKRTNQLWCDFLYHGTVINWDGEVTPCCFDKDADYSAGNAFREGSFLSTIWRGEPLQKFRQQVLLNRNDIPICANCFEGMNQPYVYYFPL